MAESSGRSKRQSIPSVKYDPESFATGWTPEEKEALLKAMKKYGTLDYENLQKAVPTKNCDRIRQFILDQAKGARHELMNKVLMKHKNKKRQGYAVDDDNIYGPIDMWLEKLKQLVSFNTNEGRTVSLTKAMQYIAMYEKQPDPSECGGVDFRAAYEFLVSMMNGVPSKDMDPITAKFILSTMGDVVRKLKKNGCDGRKQFLQETEFPIPSSSASTENPEPVAELNVNDSPRTSMDELLKLQQFNPFNLSRSDLEKKY